jgi:hypothetical protein
MGKTREHLADIWGAVYDTGEATKKFAFESFSAPVAHVVDKETGVKGTLRFQHRPRFYFDFQTNSIAHLGAIMHYRGQR